MCNGIGGVDHKLHIFYFTCGRSGEGDRKKKKRKRWKLLDNWAFFCSLSVCLPIILSMELQKMETGDHVPGDSPGVRRVRTTGGGGAAVEEPQPGLQAEGVEHRFSLGAIVQGASARIRSVSRELRSFASSLSNPSSRYEPANSTALNGLIGLRFIRKTDGAAGWPDVEKCFHKLTASTNGLLARSHFAECIGMDKDSKEFGGKLFDALARKSEIKGDSIDKAQLKQFWDQISDESFDSRLQTFFDMVDRDDDGRITEDEVKEIITLSASANHLCNIQKQADEYAALIMEALDPKNLGYIQVDKLEKVLLEASKHSRRGDSRNLSQLLSEQLRRPAENSPLVRWCQDAKYFLQDNWRRVWIIVLWIGVMSGLFAYKYVQYRNKAAYQVMGYCVCMAKGAAETLKLNMALILLPVCRNTMTWLRNKTKLRVVVPFDDNLNFHMVVAVGVAVGTGIHVVYHMACDFPRLIHASSDRFVLLESFFKEQPSNYWQLIKGVEGVTGILLVVLMVIAFTLATPWLRRGKLTGFNAFWYSHHLFVIVYALLLYHGWKLYLSKKWYQKTTWMYLAVPVVLYALERLTRAFRSSIKPVKILKAVDYSGSKGVLALHMSKPDDFEYKSGQYMFVNCAAVSPFEWHPFSITSAPGEDYLSVHIQAVGDWTKQIKKVFSEALQASPSGKGGYLEGENHPNFPKVLIDGPYGAPAQEYKNYEVVMLVGLGIGTTPMISIVKDILHNIKEMEEEEDVDVEGGNGSITKRQGAGGEYENEFKTKRAYFYWMTRGQDSFDWFKGVMDEVAELDHNGVIELHNYCTSVHERGDARSAFITMIQDLNHEKKGYDIVSGTRVKSHFAKPSWRSVFKYIARENPETEVGVFYCGPPGPTKELRKLALDFSHNTSTTFDFHKENF